MHIFYPTLVQKNTILDYACPVFLSESVDPDRTRTIGVADRSTQPRMLQVVPGARDHRLEAAYQLVLALCSGIEA